MLVITCIVLTSSNSRDIPGNPKNGLVRKKTLKQLQLPVCEQGAQAAFCEP